MKFLFLSIITGALLFVGCGESDNSNVNLPNVDPKCNQLANSQTALNQASGLTKQQQQELLQFLKGVSATLCQDYLIGSCTDGDFANMIAGNRNAVLSQSCKNQLGKFGQEWSQAANAATQKFTSSINQPGL